jgi:hypothetical protein
VFSAIKTVAGTRATIVGAVLGVPPTAAQPSELAGVISAAKALLGSVSGKLERVQVIKPGTALATVHSAWATGPGAVARSGVTVTGWPGLPVTVTVKPRPLGQAIRLGQPIALATITVGDGIHHLMLHADRTVRPPSLRWRLTRA